MKGVLLKVLKRKIIKVHLEFLDISILKNAKQL